MSERITEEIFIRESGVQLGENDFGYVFPQGDAKNFEKIISSLKKMGGKPDFSDLKDLTSVSTGKAKPEFIITFNKDKNTILVVECKPKARLHSSADFNMPKKFAVDGALFYAKHLKDDYNVIAVAVSGDSKDNIKVNTFYWKKGFESPEELNKAKDTILEPLNYLNLANGMKLQRKFSLQEIRELSLIMHEKLRQIKISEKDKPIFIAGILIALQDAGFRNSWNNISDVSVLINTLIGSIERILNDSDIKREKIDSIKLSFTKIQTNEKLKTISLGESGSLAWFIEQLELRILPMMNHYEYTEDALSIFYHEFIKYSGGDGKGLGIVLTPKHLTEFMCDLGEINKNTNVLDICCGSASFLVTAMAKMCKNANAEEIVNIKKNQIHGVELDMDLYTLAITNMIIRKDGKSNIFHGDCFDPKIFNQISKKNITLGLINPPYSQEDKNELEFVEQHLKYIQPRGLVVAVVPKSSAIGTKYKEVRERLMRNHTLKAVFSMPEDIFYPTGVMVSVMVWQAHTPHDSTKPTFFGYYADDGFVKRKKMGRIDYYNKWEEIKKEWLELYELKRAVDGKTALQCVTHEDEWLCEAYMNVDFSNLSTNDIKKTMRSYMAYTIQSGSMTSEDMKYLNNYIKNLNSSKNRVIDTTNWQRIPISMLFDVKRGKVSSLNSIEEGDTPVVSTTEINNGVIGYYNVEAMYENLMTVSFNGSCGYFAYHPYAFNANSDVGILFPKFDISINRAMFIASLANKIAFKYSYGRKLTLDRLYNENILLPVKDKNIDFEKIDSIMDKVWE
ncbi:Type I restriction-modification system methyltransferase subunit [Alteracholeplasma palmae J233]|uniref:site-specific DNA-methyltransferase (adenine-specific) n=1 Tax=Alteracholeplasma palmae (strain ATCC 49389 / J233) TaxID=1318466 RepID=U4KKV0_ALTPJ|nr:N-6 DNA methylase [Alteracholeplasma palmae]CCV64419.1 Type I restriction-modification system methyltransferase subunit [Alteracholeplasma palmae J233]